MSLDEVETPKRRGGRPSNAEIAARTAAAEAPPAPDFELYKDVPKPKMVTVELTRHYRPIGDYEVSGYWRPKVEKKNPITNVMEEVEPAKFIAGEPMPPPHAGVGGQSLKLWAGTVVKLPVDEAKTVRRNNIGTIEIDD